MFTFTITQAIIETLILTVVVFIGMSVFVKLAKAPRPKLIVGIVTVACFFTSCGLKEIVRNNTIKQNIQQKQLFPQPWLWAYEECPKVGNYRVRPAWFNAWMTKMDETQIKQLPKLSAQAVQKFAKMIAQSHKDKDFQKAFMTLSPFLKIEPPQLNKE